LPTVTTVAFSVACSSALEFRHCPGYVRCLQCAQTADTSIPLATIPLKIPIEITVNGVLRRAEVEPRLLLVHWLRDELGLTGTHIGCETGLCGACTIRLNGEAVKSCLMLAVQADGCEIHTVESLAQNGTLDPLQRAFMQEHGLQCGFCTPGMLMAAHDLLANNPKPSDEEIRGGIDGNLCRCTGYGMIIAAVRRAAETLAANRAGREVKS
jgi:aerobic carbon-monoxide dehydrogenase small subunit